MSDSKRQIPEWLQRIQENSWELELLISGGAIFTLFQADDLLLGWRASLRIFTGFPGTDILFFGVMLTTKILTLGFVLHLLSRAYWLCLVCINFVYPQGMRADGIRWVEPFSAEHESGDNLKELIEEVDRFCGMVIFMSIMSVIVLAGWLLLFVLGVGVGWWLASTSLGAMWWTAWLVGFGLYVLDLLTVGMLRRIPYVSYGLWPLFGLFDAVTLRRHYQPALFLFNTNVKKGRFLIGVSSFVVVAVLFAVGSVQKTFHWPSFYDQREHRHNMSSEPYASFAFYRDAHKPDGSYRTFIDKKVQEGNVMEYFLTYEKWMDEVINQVEGLDPNNMLAGIMHIEIDGIPMTNLVWHPASVGIYQTGIMCMIPIEDFGNGRHILRVTNVAEVVVDHEDAPRVDLEIPFWIDRKPVFTTQSGDLSIEQ